MNAADRYTIAGCLPSHRRCLVLGQRAGTEAAGGPAISVLSIDMETRALRLESACSGVIPASARGEPGWRIDGADALHPLGPPGRDGALKILVHRRARERHERQHLAVLSFDASGLRTDWVAGETLPARHAGARGWRPDPLDLIHVLPSSGPAGSGPDRCKLLVQSRPLAEPELSRLGVVSLRAPGLLTERIFEHALFAPPGASR